MRTRTEKQDTTQKAARTDGAGGFALSILFWVVIWCALAAVIDNDLLFADPFAVLASLGQSIAEPSFWMAVGYTAIRIIGIGTLSGLVALGMGALGYRFPLIHRLFAPPLQVMKSAPVACVVVIVLVMWGAHGAFATIVAFVAFPPFYIAIQQALAERPRATEEVLTLLGVSRWRVFCACTWPAALPFFTAASKTAVALSWRAGITAELLCLPLGSIGAAVYASKLTLDSAGLLAWTIVVMLLSWLNEKAVLGLLAWSRKLSTLALADGKRSAAAALTVATPSPASAPAAPSESSPTAQRDLPGEAAHLTLDAVHKRYGDTIVLEAFSLAIRPGERICLMAPTGSGKSTALRILARLSMPDTGSTQAPARIGIVMQGPTLVKDLTACQNVALAAAPHISATRIHQHLEGLISADAVDRPAADLSGGTQRLVELVRAMLSDGQAIVLDEPFTGLDAARREAACAFIMTTLSDRPLIIATHDPRDATLLDAAIVRL